jgi:hypothetical protein
MLVGKWFLRITYVVGTYFQFLLQNVVSLNYLY